MAKYWLSFRIADETSHDGRDHADRYNALYDAIDEISTRWWLDTTSFVIFESARDIDDIASVCALAIDTDIDCVLLRALDRKSARLVGKSEDKQTLLKFMPYIETL